MCVCVWGEYMCVWGARVCVWGGVCTKYLLLLCCKWYVTFSLKPELTLEMDEVCVCIMTVCMCSTLYDGPSVCSAMIVSVLSGSLNRYTADNCPWNSTSSVAAGDVPRKHLSYTYTKYKSMVSLVHNNDHGAYTVSKTLA